MDIDKSNASSHQVISINENQEFIKFNRWGHWKGSKQGDDFVPVFHITAGKFANDKLMAYHLRVY